MIGNELCHSPRSSFFEKIYIRIFGVPISGLRIRLRRVLPALTGNPQKVLDAGCGRGIFSYQLSKRFPTADVIGVDIDNDQLDINRTIAKDTGLANLSFLQDDIAHLAFDQEFDLVLSVDNLEHLEDDRLGLNCLYKALKENGRLVLHVPGYERRWFFFKFTTNFDVPGHFRPGYKLEEIKQKVVEAGFQLNSAHYTFGWLETITNNVSYLVTRAEAKNKLIYALFFPLLNIIAWFGRHAKPAKGAGILLRATKPQVEL